MEEKNQKLSYEKLEGVAVQLQNRCVELENRLRSIDLSAMRLNYLFKVIENRDAFPEDFVKQSTADIVDMLTPPAEESKEDTTKEE